MNRELKKSIGIVFISFLTLGLANTVFIYIFSDMAVKDEHGKIIYPMRCAVLNVITLGIYGGIWIYKMGKKLDVSDKNPAPSRQTVAFCVLSFVFLRGISLANIYYRMKTRIA